jgi:hypothetical protein
MLGDSQRRGGAKEVEKIFFGVNGTLPPKARLAQW